MARRWTCGAWAASLPSCLWASPSSQVCGHRLCWATPRPAHCALQVHGQRLRQAAGGPRCLVCQTPILPLPLVVAVRKAPAGHLMPKLRSARALLALCSGALVGLPYRMSKLLCVGLSAPSLLPVIAPLWGSGRSNPACAPVLCGPALARAYCVGWRQSLHAVWAGRRQCLLMHKPEALSEHCACPACAPRSFNLPCTWRAPLACVAIAAAAAQGAPNVGRLAVALLD